MKNFNIEDAFAQYFASICTEQFVCNIMEVARRISYSFLESFTNTCKDFLTKTTYIYFFPPYVDLVFTDVFVMNKTVLGIL